MVHQLDVQRLQNFVGHFLEVLGVVPGYDHGRHTRAAGGEELFTQTTDGQHPPAQGDFPGHGHVVADRDAEQGRDEACGDGDARRGAVLGRRAFGEVRMDVDFAVEIGFQAKGRPS